MVYTEEVISKLIADGKAVRETAQIGGSSITMYEGSMYLRCYLDKEFDIHTQTTDGNGAKTHAVVKSNYVRFGLPQVRKVLKSMNDSVATDIANVLTPASKPDVIDSALRNCGISFVYHRVEPNEEYELEDGSKVSNPYTWFHPHVESIGISVDAKRNAAMRDENVPLELKMKLCQNKYGNIF